MTPYRDISGRSGIDSYEIRERAILVRFKHNNKIYIYDYAVPGAESVEEMKKLAASGKNLATYISRTIRGRYSRAI